jgi:hypothetical protein
MRCLERDELWFDRHPALAFCLSMIPRVKPEGMLFGKPDSTFPDHALAEAAFANTDCGDELLDRIYASRTGLSSRPRLCSFVLGNIGDRCEIAILCAPLFLGVLRRISGTS